MPFVALISPVIWLLLGIEFRDSFRVATVVICAILLTLAAQLQDIGRIDPIKVIGGFFLLATALLAASRSIRFSREQSWHYLRRAMIILAWLQLSVQLIELAEFVSLRQSAPQHYIFPIPRYSGLYAEPSHLAVSYSPFIIAMAGRWWGIFGGRLTWPLWIPTAASLILCPSATLLAVAVAGSIFALGRNIVLALCFAGLFTSIAWFFSDEILQALPIEISARITTIFEIVGLGYFDNKTNLSSLVFYGGAQASLSVLQNYPLGVGFQNLSAAYSLPELMQYRYFVGDRNINDGGSIAFKVIGEFGIVGLFFWVWCMAKTYLICRTPEMKEIAFLTFPIVAFSIRGASYFDGPVLIAFAVLILGRGLIASGRKPTQGYRDFRTVGSA